MGQISSVEAFMRTAQQSIMSVLSNADGAASFIEDDWQYNGKGGGITSLLTDGQVFESAGVNFSSITGSALPPAATEKRPKLAGMPFRAMGVSVVVHPHSPMVPTSHANFRFISVEQENGQSQWWFGGGFDLTPYYGFVDDCIIWHKAAQSACLPYGDDVYQQFKQCCDEYFYLPHRQEPRGIGGLFFDDLNYWSFSDCFAFIKAVAAAYQDVYQAIVARRKIMSFTQAQKEFQLYRRGRYVEFNLLYDRGTLFGLQSKGRTESIFMSLPPRVAWRYNWQPDFGTAEAELYNYYLQPRDWLQETDLELKSVCNETG